MTTEPMPYTTDDDANYTFLRPVTPDEILTVAESILEGRMCRGEPLGSPADTKRYLAIELGRLEQEVFCCLFLDNRNRILSFDRMFSGTVNGASVHPREVVKRALSYNAAAIICAHNHPSGVVEPSTADRGLTRRLHDACALVDVRLIDHIVVGGSEALSFAEQGYL